MKINKILIVVLIITLIIICLGTNTFAFGDTVTNGIISGKKFTQQGTTNVLNYSGVNNVLEAIYGFMYITAIIVAVVYGFYIAARIIVSSSAEEKVDTKKMIVQYIKNVAIIALIPITFGVILNIVQNII